MKRLLEYSSDMLALHITIPVRHGATQFDEAFLFLTEYPVSLRKKSDSAIVAELEKFVGDEPTEISAHCKRFDPTYNSLLCLYAEIESLGCSLWQFKATPHKACVQDVLSGGLCAVLP